jgi:hypothetical protein
MVRMEGGGLPRRLDLFPSGSCWRLFLGVASFRVRRVQAVGSRCARAGVAATFGFSDDIAHARYLATLAGPSGAAPRSSSTKSAQASARTVAQELPRIQRRLDECFFKESVSYRDSSRRFGGHEEPVKCLRFSIGMHGKAQRLSADIHTFIIVPRTPESADRPRRIDRASGRNGGTQ